MKTLVIYHGNCADGFTAAWIVRQALGHSKFESSYQDLPQSGLEFHAGFYQTPPPDVADKIVYIVDFSYKRPVMEELVTKAKKVIHIDHHDTAIRDMAGFESDNFESYYSPDNTESGAMLTWKYFFPTRPAPEFIKHIDDRDRWQFKMPGTREVQSNIFSYEYTFENWDMLINQSIDEQIREGTAIERRMAKDVKELLGVVVRRMNIAGYDVPVANVPYQYGSDICHALAKNEPFAAYYYDRPTGREFGLRSSEDGLHVGAIAAQFGGGGHEHASGFRVSYEQAAVFEIK
jgi:oligoribonuclease NrnB/cAMP/cGMP phosphodiesterase (DHH superfamily)